MGLEKGCPCCKVYNDDLEFKRIMQLESAGLVIYRHTTPVNIDASVSQPEKAFNTNDNVFIIHNTKNRNVSTSNYMSEFEQAINCPRCRYIVKHTKELLLSVSFIRKKDAIGICDHCRWKKRINERCKKCQIVVEEFLKKRVQKQTERHDSGKQEKVIESKIKHILKDAPKEIYRKSKTQLRSETSLKNLNLSGKKSPTSHVPRVKDMFEIKKESEKINQHLKKGFLRQIETTKLYKNKSDSEITLVESKRRLEHNEPKKNILFNSAENIAWPESVNESAESIGFDNKPQHRLRQKHKPKIELDLKQLPSSELEDYLKKENYISSPINYEKQKLPSLKSDIHEIESIKVQREDQHGYEDIHQAKYDQEVSKSSQKEEDIFLRGIQKQSSSVHDIRRYPSEETLLRSASEQTTTEPKLHKDFSYFFIKETDVVKKPPRKRVSSSELIKDTQDMYRARAEEERIKKEQELKDKLEAEEKKRLAKIERKRRLEEERRLEELKKKKAEEERRLEEIRKKKEEEKQDLKNKKLSKQDTESPKKSLKSSKEPSEKSKSIKLKTEIKESKIDKPLKSERDSGKSKKEVDKQDKEELKEKKLKEKPEKDEQMREVKQKQKEDKEKEKANKEEQMRLAKEEKERQKKEKEKEKSNQEEQMRIAKEQKQKEKEEKEKEKANKEEQIRIAKEQKQKEKEDKERQEAQLRMEKEQKQREKEERLKAKEERQKEKEQSRQQKEEIVSKDNEENIKNKQIEQQLIDQQKEKELKKKKKQEEEAKKQEAQLKLKSLRESKAEEQPEKPQNNKFTEESKMKDLNINQVKIRKNSADDLILQLVKLKKTQGSVKERPTRMSQINIPSKMLYDHMASHKNMKTDSCMVCLDSDLELDIENIRLNETKPEEINDIIIGQKIFKYKPPLVTKKEDKVIQPLLFNSTQTDDENNIVKTQEVKENIAQEKEKKPPVLSAKYVEQEVPKGIIRYALSDRTFIEKGWTMLPTEKVVRKMNVYRMRPAHPEFDWFEHNKNKKLICYDTGEKLAEIDDKGKGRWFYRSGRVALDYYDAEEINAQQRIIIFSSGEPDERGCSRPFAILATFDYLGNGIVFDHSGKIRLKYNQTEGVVLDRAIGPVSHWKWHTLNDPPVLQQVMIDTQMAHKDPEILKLGGPHDDKPRPDNEEMLAIEFDNFIKEKSKKLSQKFKPFQIKMKALKINEYFSLKVLDQATIYLIYRDGSTNLKLNIGMILDHHEIVDTDTAEVGEVSNSLERFPARTDSLAGLQKSVAHAQRVERARAERTQRLRPAQPCASADRLVAGLARPARPAPPPGQGSCPCRKPSTFNLYYDTRLI